VDARSARQSARFAGPTALVALVALVAAHPAGAAPASAAHAPDARPDGVSMAVLDFVAGSPADAELGKSVALLVATRLSARPGLRVAASEEIRAALGLERVRQLAGCGEDACAAEIAGTLGVHYLLRGRIDRFGPKLVVSAFVLDARSAQSLARMREDIARDEELPAAADRLGDGAALALGIAPAAAAAPLRPSWHLNVKLGNTLAALAGIDFRGLVLKGDLEFDWYARPWLLVWLQSGLVLGTQATSSGGGQPSTFSLMPLSFGAKYQFRADRSLRPYAGLGLGAGVLLAALSSGDARRVAPGVNGIVGVVWFPWDAVGVNLEAGVNLAGFEVRGDNSLFFAFHTDFGVVFAFK